MIPYCGFTSCWFKNADYARTKFLISVLCGPLVTLSLVLGSFANASDPQFKGTPGTGLLIFAGVNSLILLLVMIPRTLTVGSQKTSSDLLLMGETLSLSDEQIDDWVFSRHWLESDECQDRGDFVGAKRWLVQGLLERPNDRECLFLLGFANYNIGDFAAARQTWAQWLELSPRDSLERPHVLNGIVCCDLHGEALETPPKRCAKRSTEAVAAMPWIPGAPGDETATSGGPWRKLPGVVMARDRYSPGRTAIQ